MQVLRRSCNDRHETNCGDYVDFITIALDQIINQAAKVRYIRWKCEVPAVFRTQVCAVMRAALAESGSWLAHIPGLKVVMPSVHMTPRACLKSIRDPNQPLHREQGSILEG